MATAFRSSVHTQVYTTLDGAVSGFDVFDYVPDKFPYIVVGDTETTPFDNDSTLGAYVDMSIYVYSRYKGRKEVAGALDSIYALLHRASLTAAGYKIVDCLFEFSDVLKLQDGKTRQGVIRFRITIQEA